VRGPFSGFPGRLATGLLAIVSITLALVANGGADRAAPPRPNAATLRSRADALETRAHRALLDLYSIDTKLGSARDRLASLEDETARIRAAEALVRRQVGIARRSLSSSRRDLAVRLRLMYEHGDPDPLSVVLGATSLEDAISGLDDLAQANRQSRNAIGQTRTTQRMLTRKLELLASRGVRLATLTSQARETEAGLALARSQRADLLDSLRTMARLDRRRIAALTASARAAEAKSQALAASKPAQASSESVASPTPSGALPTAVDPPATDGTRTLTVIVTGYSLEGHTATGLPVGWGVAAVDPALIPLGTRLSVPGYGDAVAADVGGGVRGTMIDLWFPTRAQARAWGRRLVTITLG
jgi:3D (Asp-Asp-Asp) domain-containing protein